MTGVQTCALPILWYLDPILMFFGATLETVSYAREFMEVILYATPVSYVFIGLNNLMRATGYPRKAMISALLSVVVNVALAPLFIYTFDWGIAGAAWATNCGQFAAFIWVLHHFLSKKSFVHFNPRNRWCTGSILKKIYAIGLCLIDQNSQLGYSDGLNVGPSLSSSSRMSVC